jgi:hypothetical protein
MFQSVGPPAQHACKHTCVTANQLRTVTLLILMGCVAMFVFGLGLIISLLFSMQVSVTHAVKCSIREARMR